jgi:hypothetical protein
LRPFRAGFDTCRDDPGRWFPPPLRRGGNQET